MRLWPRTFRLQMLAGLVLLETLSMLLFSGLLFHQQTQDIYKRARVRLTFEASSMALQASEALQQQRPGWVGLSVKMMGEAPTVSKAKVTDPAGNMYGTTVNGGVNNKGSVFMVTPSGNETVLYSFAG